MPMNETFPRLRLYKDTQTEISTRWNRQPHFNWFCIKNIEIKLKTCLSTILPSPKLGQGQKSPRNLRFITAGCPLNTKHRSIASKAPCTLAMLPTAHQVGRSFLQAV